MGDLAVSRGAGSATFLVTMFAPSLTSLLTCSHRSELVKIQDHSKIDSVVHRERLLVLVCFLAAEMCDRSMSRVRRTLNMPLRCIKLQASSIIFRDSCDHVLKLVVPSSQI